MSFQQSFDGLSQASSEALSNGEGEEVDFKVEAKGLSSEDLVAFANSARGGRILLGVKAAERSDGSQFGEITGHDLSDATILMILNKAVGCVPPIAISLFAENRSANPIIRARSPVVPTDPIRRQKEFTALGMAAGIAPWPRVSCSQSF